MAERLIHYLREKANAVLDYIIPYRYYGRGIGFMEGIDDVENGINPGNIVVTRNRFERHFDPLLEVNFGESKSR